MARARETWGGPGSGARVLGPYLPACRAPGRAWTVGAWVCESLRGRAGRAGVRACEGREPVRAGAAASLALGESGVRRGVQGMQGRAGHAGLPGHASRYGVVARTGRANVCGSVRVGVGLQIDARVRVDARGPDMNARRLDGRDCAGDVGRASCARISVARIMSGVGRRRGRRRACLRAVPVRRAHPRPHVLALARAHETAAEVVCARERISKWEKRRRTVVQLVLHHPCARPRTPLRLCAASLPSPLCTRPHR